jgi:hypothetical protein
MEINQFFIRADSRDSRLNPLPLVSLASLAVDFSDFAVLLGSGSDDWLCVTLRGILAFSSSRSIVIQARPGRYR